MSFPPKHKKAAPKKDSFSNAFDQSLTGSNDTDVMEQPEESSKPANDGFSSAFDQSLKKKGTDNSTNGLDQSGSETPLPSKETVDLGASVFDNSTLNPSLQKPVSITTPDGGQLSITNPTPLENSIEGLKDIQDRVTKKIATPEDIQLLATASGKSPEAAKAYLTNGQTAGALVENNDNVQKSKDNIANFIGKYNAAHHTQFDPNQIMSSSKSLSDFLNLAKSTTLQTAKNQDVSQPLNQSEIQKGSLSLGMTPVTDEMLNQVVQKTVQEDKDSGVPQGETISKVYKQINPKDFQRVQQANTPALSNIATLAGVNPLGAIGDLLRDNKGEDELLNYQKGIAELKYNDALKQNAVNKMSQGYIDGNQDLIKQGQQDLSQVDNNVVDRYPALQKQQMVQQVNDAIAKESGLMEGTSANSLNDYKEKVFGASNADRIRVMQEKGFFDNPKTRDAAISLINNPQLFADDSILGGAPSSFYEPFKNLGISIGDITGVRNNKDIISDSFKDEIFPKQTEGVIPDFTLLGHDFRVRNIVNTTANLAGMLAISSASEGLGTGAGLSINAAKQLGAYTSFGLPSFDASLKDSKSFIDSEPAQYLYASINAIANAEGGRVLDLGKITRIPGVSAVFADAANKLTDKSITADAIKELLKKGEQPYVDFALKYGKSYVGNVTKGAATMTYFNIANNVVKMAFGDPNTSKQDVVTQAANSFLDGVLGMSIMGGFGAVADMRNEKNTSFKGNIYNMALNHDSAKDVFDLGLKNGDYNQQEYDQKIQILNTAVAAKNALETTSNETGTELTQDQKSVYVANKTAQAVFKKNAEKEGIPEETKNKWLAQSDKLAEQSTQILDGLKFTSTLEPLYNLYNAEKEYNAAKDNFNPSDKASDDALLAAKDNYDKLYSDYLKDKSDAPIPVKNKPIEPAKKVEPTEVSDTEILPTFEKVKSFVPEEKLDETQNVITKINNAENINVDDLSKAEDNLYTALDKAPEAAHLIEPLILKIQNYPDEFKTKTETGTTTEKVPIEGAYAAKSKTKEIKPALEQSAGSDASITNPDGSTVKGKLNIKSGQYVLDVPDGGAQRIIGEKAITDRDLTLPDANEMDNPIEFDKDGNVQSVTFKTGKGDLVTIHDPEKALDIAIQLQADKVGAIPDEAFEKAYQDVQKEIQKEVPISQSKPNKNESSKKSDGKKSGEGSGQEGSTGSQENGKKDDVKNQGVGTNEETAPLIQAYRDKTGVTQDAVSDEDLLKNIAEQAQNISGGKENKTGDSEKLYDSTVNQTGSKELVDAAIKAYPKEDLLNEDKGATPKEKPPTPPENIEQEDKGTHINKDDITTDKDLVNKFPIAGGKVGWEESVNSAMEDLSKEAKKGESLFDVAERKVNNWLDKINQELADRGKSTFNPSDEDLAVMSYYRTNINEGINKLKDPLNSESEPERLDALSKAKNLQEKLLNVDKVLSESGRVAGRSFYIRQAVAKMDAKNNLLVRRMDIMRSQGGEPLSPDQEAAVAKVVSEENGLQKDFNNNIPKFSQEDFDAKVKEEVARVLRERKVKSTDTKQEKTLKQSGDEWAAKIKKLKIKTDPNSLQSNILGLPIAAYNALIDGISLAVKGGATIAEAIGNALKEDRFKGVNEDSLKNHLFNQIDKQDNLDKIEGLAKEEKSDNLTKSAVGKNLINDLANNYIDEGLRGKAVFEQMNTDLKEIFPNITEQQVRDAYLKTGEYYLDSKQVIDKDKKEAQSQLKNIASLESKLEDARKGKVGAKSDKELRKWTDTENRLSKELASELNKKNINLEKSPKEEVAIKKKVADAHNDRMDAIIKKVDEQISEGENTPEEKKSLKDLKNQLELSKVNSDTSQKIDEALIKASNDLRDTAIDIVGNKEIFNEVNKSLSELNNDIKDASQDILVTRYKKQLQNKIKESERKIEANEFNDDKTTVRNKVDAETIRYEIEQRKIDAKYRRLKYLAEQKNKKWWEKGISFAQSFLVDELIGGLNTAGVVLSSGVTKQPLNTLTNLTFGSVAHAINPELSKAAGSEAPISFRQEKNRYLAHYAGIGEAGMNKRLDKSENALKEANRNYDAIKKQFNNAEEGTPEYNKLKKQLTKAENKQTTALLDHQSNFLYKWIGSNAWKDAGKVFTEGASQLDNLFGHKEAVAWKDKTNLEKTQYVMGMMGALHGTFKNFSARAEFAAAFTARLEQKSRNGIDISTPEEILRTANESFVNYLMGKYQEDNYVTSVMNRVSKTLEEVGNEPSRYGADRMPKNTNVGKLASAAFKGRFPIIKTGINIGREAIQEYMLGSLWGGAIHGNAVIKGIFNGSKEGQNIQDSIKKEISKMSPDKVDLIFRCYRKGGLGLVMAGFAALGYIKFGGFYNDDDYRRKAGERKQGELEIFGHKLDHKNILAKMYEHAGVTMPSLMIANTREVFERKFSRGKDAGNKKAAITDALVSDLEGAMNIIPPLNTGLGNPLKNPSVPYGRAAADVSEYFDRNQNGDVIQRDNSTLWNRFLMNTGFRKFVPLKQSK